MRILITTLFASLLTATLSAQNSAWDINHKLGRGINFGNMFENEGGWGAEVQPYYLEEISDKGFSSLRLPVRWSKYTLADPPYTIEPEFIDTIKTVVDLALKNKLLVVMNMHHYDEIFDDPDGHTDRFLAIWDQLSIAFQDYSDSLLFELLNEPHNNLDQARWNALFPIALDTVRKENPTRKVVIGPPDWNGIGSVNKLDWPENDTNLIMTVHYYNPFQFTHQGASWVTGADAWLGTTWDSTAAELQAVINDFAAAVSWSESHDVPVYVGEFGSYSRADMDSRRMWTAYVPRIIESFGFSWAYWEFKAGFGAYDAANGFWRNHLLYGLTAQLDPNEFFPDPWEIGNPEFTRGTGGWEFWTQGGSVATLSGIGGEAVVDISTATDQPWHIQLAQLGLEILKGSEYKVTFDARAETPLPTISPTVGKNSDPYNSYSGSNSVTLTEEMTTYTFSFTMTEPSDDRARLVFNLSDVATKIYFDNIQIELLYMPTYVEQITVGPEDASIVEKNGSIQLTAEVLPEDATNNGVDWEITSGSSRAEINSQGVLTANGTSDGNVKVRATAEDGSGVFGELVVSISNQTVGIEQNPTRTLSAYITTGVLHYSLQPGEGSRRLKLYTIDGRLQYEEVLEPQTASGTIQLKDSRASLYLLEVTGDGRREFCKIAGAAK